MKRISFAVILAIVSVLFSGYANATVAHPKNPDIVGAVFYGFVACFNNDGVVVDGDECNTSEFDEGYVVVTSSYWEGGASSGINGCGTAAVSSVSSATCPYTKGVFATCTGNGYALVQTTKSGHFWAVKANASCTNIATPETTGLVPCLSSDVFDPAKGCTPSLNPPVMAVKEGYIQLDSYGSVPPAAHCDDPSHNGRMVVDSVNGLIYICTQIGWESISTVTP